MDQVANNLLNKNNNSQENENETSISNLPEEVQIKVKFLSNTDIIDNSIEISSVSSSETIAFVKHNLGEILETCSITSYRLDFLQAIDKNGDSLISNNIEACNDYTELSSLLLPNAEILEFSLVLERYDLKKVQFHIRKLKEVINDPPTISAKRLKAIQHSTLSETKKDDTPDSEKKSNLSIPKLEEYLKPIQISEFYNETIYRVGNVDAVDNKAHSLDDTDKPPLASIVKSVFASGWNPPLPARKLQGDLLYLEVITSADGTFHVTCNSKGYYVNRSNRTHFDPSPASKHCFSHELFETLMLHCPSLHTAWNSISNRLNQDLKENPHDEAETSILDTLALAFSTGKGLETTTHSFQWNASKNTMTTLSEQSYDMYRVQQELSSLYGVEELGPNREWNDEIQTIRSLSAESVDDRIMKAKLECKIVSEFTNACRTIAVAIADGLIAPISLADPSQAQIYLYNGIFFSKTEDSKDTFEICSGDEAYRKTTARELQNQKVIRSLDIEGLSLTLIAIVDYKGDRYIGQSVIPGIFSQAENVARLMYGILESDKILTVKNSSFKIMQDVCSKLNIPVRNMKLRPFNKNSNSNSELCEAAVSLEQIVNGASVVSLKHRENNHKSTDAVENDSEQNSDTPQTQIRVDEIDNIVDFHSTSTPHCGPVEGKLLYGSDGRVYALEMMRLTPRDANYVTSEAKGSNKIDASVLNSMDQTLFTTYILRPELVKSYIQNKIHLEQQKIITDAFRMEKDLEQQNNSSVEKKEEEVVVLAGTVVGSVAAATTNPESKVTLESIISKHETELQRINAKSLDINVNPNCFMNFYLDVDASVIVKDENTAREMAVYLWDNVLSHINKQVRDEEISFTDNAAMVNMLHAKGVNVRYIGHLATLAQKQEERDHEIFLEEKQVIQPIPYVWHELLVTEMIARAVKHILNHYYKTNSAVYAAPAQTIVSMINYIMNLINNTSVKLEKTTSSNNVLPVPSYVKTETTTCAIVSDKKSSKHKKKKSASQNVVQSTTTTGESSSDIFTMPDATQSYETFIKSMLNDIQSKYCYNLSQVLLCTDNDDATTTNTLKYKSFDITRLSCYVVLRRICQVCGICIATKAYDFKSIKPIAVNDIVSLVPIVSSSEPIILSTDFKELFDTSIALLDQGEISNAYEFAQQALRVVTQIAGPYHELTCNVLDHISNIFLQGGDYPNALAYASKNLSIISQIKSIDCDESLQLHSKLSNCHFMCGNIKSAMNHLLVVKYLLQLFSGNRNPLLSGVFTHLALIYDHTGDLDSALNSYNQSIVCLNNFLQATMISIQQAALYYRKGLIEEAISIQKRAYVILKNVFGDDINNQQLIEIKKTLEIYMRENMNKNQNILTSIEKLLEEKLKISTINDTTNTIKNPITKQSLAPLSSPNSIDLNELIKSFEKDEKDNKNKNNSNKKNNKNKK